MTTLLPVDKVHDEHGDFRSRDDDKAGWTFDSFFSDCEVTLMMNWATRWRKMVVRVNWARMAARL